MGIGSQARMLPTGTYTTEEDLRSVLEGSRQLLLGGAARNFQLNHKMAAANIGYNVLLEAVESKLRAATTFEQFKAVYEWLGTVEELPIPRKQEEFLNELGIKDTAPAAMKVKTSGDPESLLPESSIPVTGLAGHVFRQPTSPSSGG